MLASTARRSMAALVAVFALAACGGEDQVEATEDAVRAGADSIAANSPLAQAPMSDANILAAVGAANAAEIAAGELAGQKARDAEVKAFGRMMVTEHQAMQKQADSIITASNLQPQPATNADSIQRAATATADSLKALSGAEFDRAYIAAQVRDHQNTLTALQQFAGAAQNAQLRTMLQGAMPKVQQHLDRATQLQAKLGGSTAAGTTQAGAATSGR